jgi:putative colanic acid biosynthesis acetyltransferase WcaF
MQSVDIPAIVSPGFDVHGGVPYTGPCYSLGNRTARALWNCVWMFLFLPSPRPFHAWRRFLLRCFGARIGRGSRIYPRARIWAPWKLQIGEMVAIADGSEIYNPAAVHIGDYAVISQGAYLCGASHDYRLWSFPLLARAILVGPYAWVAARAIVHMGVRLGKGCVIGAGSVVTHDMPAWTVCVGNPCRVLRSYEKSDHGL